MAINKKLDDSIRTKILAAMQKKGSDVPNIRQIQKITGFHRATIKSSIDFFEKQNFITGYRPLLDPKIISYDLKSFVYLQVDVSQKDKFKKFLKLVEKDNNVFSCSEVISNGEHNLAISFISKDIENQHNNIRKKYLLTIPNYFDFVKKTTSFYLSAPFYKQKNIIDSVIDLLKEKHGLD